MLDFPDCFMYCPEVVLTALGDQERNITSAAVSVRCACPVFPDW